MSGPVDVFISYAQEDEKHLVELEKHLAELQRQCLIHAWHSGKVEAGLGYRTLVESHVSTAPIILLLVSASFIASDTCHDQMDRALKRRARGEARVVPILVEPCDWEPASLGRLGRLKPLPDNGIPVTAREWHSPPAAWANVARSLRGIIERMAQQAASAAPGAALLPPPNQPPGAPRRRRIPTRVRRIHRIGRAPRRRRIPIPVGRARRRCPTLPRSLLWGALRIQRPPAPPRLRGYRRRRPPRPAAPRACRPGWRR